MALKRFVFDRECNLTQRESWPYAWDETGWRCSGRHEQPLRACCNPSIGLVLAHARSSRHPKLVHAGRQGSTLGGLFGTFIVQALTRTGVATAVGL